MAEKKISPPEGYEKLVTALARKISIACKNIEKSRAVKQKIIEELKSAGVKDEKTFKRLAVCLWHEINPKSKTFSFAHIFGGVIGHKPKPRKKKEEGSH